MLRREQKVRNIILFTLFSLVFIGVGYAVISSNLQMNGSMTLNKITWDVHFENFEELYDNTVTGTKTLTNNNTTLTYNVNLNKPGDVFEFTIDVVNNGNIDAMLSNIGNNGLTSAQQEVMDYSVKYLDGTTPTVKDSLKVGEVETFVVSVKTKVDITNSQLAGTDTNLTLTFNPTYSQDDETSTIRNTSLYSKIVDGAELDNKSSTYVSSSSGIDFTAASSNENGKGIYLINSTKNDTNPIYYYRGEVDNNNVKFGEFCWKIVRTTETGGIKLIYNGTPDESGYCNKTGENTVIEQYKYNNSNSPAYNGYMYGKVYYMLSKEYSNEYKYSNTFEYSTQNNTYTLTNATNTITNLSNNHYTCFNSTGMCNSLAYIFYTENGTAYYILLENNKSVDDAKNEMRQNFYDSNNKIKIDDWYKNHLINKSKYLDDTIWCNDRNENTIQSTNGNYINSGWNLLGGKIDSKIFYAPYGRRYNGQLSFSCTSTIDSFTVKNENGNKKLIYPISLLTLDELILAGGNKSADNNYYLKNGVMWWTISPCNYDKESQNNFVCTDTGKVVGKALGYAAGIRPAISLKKGTKITGGDGTQNNPYVIN